MVMHCIINIIFLMSALFITCEPTLWYYGVILMPLFAGIVLVLVPVAEVLVLVLEATVLETSLPQTG